MRTTLFAFFALLYFAGCSSSQFALYRPKNSENQWNISVSKNAIGKFTVSINDSIVIAESPGLISHTLEAKGTYQGHEIKLFAVYNSGFLGIGSGWETTIFIENEIATRFKL